MRIFFRLGAGLGAQSRSRLRLVCPHLPPASSQSFSSSLRYRRKKVVFHCPLGHIFLMTARVDSPTISPRHRRDRLLPSRFCFQLPFLCLLLAISSTILL